jgi:hypothetical protein
MPSRQSIPESERQSSVIFKRLSGVALKMSQSPRFLEEIGASIKLNRRKPRTRLPTAAKAGMDCNPYTEVESGGSLVSRTRPFPYSRKRRLLEAGRSSVQFTILRPTRGPL